VLVPFDGSSRDLGMTTFRLCRRGEGFVIVAIVLPPRSLGADLADIRFHCSTTGRRAGGIADEGFVYWHLFQPLLRPGAFLVTADLAELVEFEVVRGAGQEDLARAPADELIRLEYGADETLPAWQNLVVPGRITLPIPGNDHMLRVAGPIGTLGFITTGASWFHNLEQLVRRYLRADLRDLGAILDWGCGCGRIVRHGVERGLENLFGVDIDAYNIDWLRGHFPRGTYLRTDFDPPLPFADGTFDVVFGHSVFTHLAEADQDLWLAEIARVLKPGGYAFVTVCTEFGAAVAHAGEFAADPGLCGRLVADGLVVLATQPVGVDEGRSGYYKLTCHATDYVMRHWSRFLEVRRIVRCFAEHQDLVVLRRA